jgi:transcriptional regulator with XRE-family HTH domain
MPPLHEKIDRLLTQRGLLKRDLARALSVSPQTATDICKGRSAVTLSHLRKLVSFFRLSADYWIDDTRSEPTEADETGSERAQKIRALARIGLLDAPDPAALFERMRDFIIAHREEYMRQPAPLSVEERRILGLAGSAQGRMGRVTDAGD